MKQTNPLPVKQLVVSQGMWMITHPYVLALWLIAGLVSAWKGWTTPAVFCGFIFVFFTTTRIWGLTALRRVSFKISDPVPGLFPGQRLTLTRIVRNAKALPLLWLEILEPYDPNGCLQAEERYIARRDDPEGKHSYFCLYTLILVKWRQTVRFTDEWLAVRRGIRSVNKVELRSGDSLGLCPASRLFLLEQACMVAVYPALVGVDVELVLRDIWDSFSSSAGSLEDTVWIKSIRDYLPQDPACRINQHLLARGQGLKVNQYEVVAPDEILFIMDTASYCGVSAAALEESLSILASLISELQARGIRVGLLAPSSDYFPQTYVTPSNQTSDLARMLRHLASVQAHDPPLNRVSTILSANAPGQVYYLVYGLQTATSLDVLDEFPPHKCQVLIYTQVHDDRQAGGWRVRTLTDLRKY